MTRIYPQQYFRRPVREIAPALIGSTLAVRAGKGKILRHRITEVEAYDGPHDKACHASRGRTARTEALFWRGGVFYVYLVYGMHYMLNIVTNERDYPAAVLIRSIDTVSGPGRLTRALGVDTAIHAKPVRRETGVWLEQTAEKIPESEIKTTPRIGIEYAQEWKDAPLRFVWTK